MKPKIFFFILIFTLIIFKQGFSQHTLHAGLNNSFGNSSLNFSGTRNSLQDESNLINYVFSSAYFAYEINKKYCFSSSWFFSEYSWAYVDNNVVEINNGDYALIQAKSSSYITGFSVGFRKNGFFTYKNKLGYYFETNYFYGFPNFNKKTIDYSDYEPALKINESNNFKNYNAIDFKVGLLFNISESASFRIFTGYSYSFSPIFQNEFSYNFNGENEYVTISSKGSRIYTGLAINFTLVNFTKIKEKKNKIIPDIDDSGEIISLNNRPIKKEHYIEIHNSKISIEIWDNKKVDGDRISLFLDNNNILDDYKLQREKKIIQVNLKSGKNSLIVFAHNLGRDPPNTASVIIIDGENTHKVSLSSTLGKCGSITLFLNK